jgi:large subunit ribosomal protein L5
MATTETYVPRLKQRYDDEIRPALKDELELDSIMRVPRVTKITLNMGVGDAKTDAKAMDAAIEELSTIAGQHAQIRRARKSIASFKLREGMAVGARVTLRGAKMYEFLDRLVSIALPRVRDFKGVSPKGFDGRGNYTLGLRDQLLFPEIDYMKVDKARGMNVSVVTTARTDEEARKLLQFIGMPFRQ